MAQSAPPSRCCRSKRSGFPDGASPRKSSPPVSARSATLARTPALPPAPVRLQSGCVACGPRFPILQHPCAASAARYPRAFAPQGISTSCPRLAGPMSGGGEVLHSSKSAAAFYSKALFGSLSRIKIDAALPLWGCCFLRVSVQRYHFFCISPQSFDARQCPNRHTGIQAPDPSPSPALS
jgi:hypothetical protein